MSKIQQIAQAYFRVQQLQKMADDVKKLRDMQNAPGSLELKIGDDIVTIDMQAIKNKSLQTIINDLDKLIFIEGRAINLIEIK